MSHQQQTPPQTSGFAVTSFVLGLVWLGWLGSFLAVIFGHIALRKMKGGYQRGKGLAVAGLVLGYIGIGTLLIFIITAVGLSEEPNSNGGSPPSGSEQSLEKPKEAQIGNAVRDGKFEFIVHGVECGDTTIGSSDFVEIEAQGQYCYVDVTVKNIADSSQTLLGSDQYLLDSDGREYSADTEASFYLDESDMVFEEINPGNSLDGIIVYDIPEDVEPVEIELHDSAFSGGVSVSL